MFILSSNAYSNTYNIESEIQSSPFQSKIIPTYLIQTKMIQSVPLLSKISNSVYFRPRYLLPYHNTIVP
jgi:hypothetical protein